jgi:hypothetical protein
MKFYLFFLGVLLSIIGLTFWQREPQKEVASSRELHKSLSPAEHLAAAKNLLSKPIVPADIGSIETHLRAIPTDHTEYKEVPGLLRKTAIEEKRIIKDIAAKRRSRGIINRQLFVEELEWEYLSKGFDVHLSATGTEKTIFTFKFVLVSRPAVYQLSNSDSFMSSLRSREFKKAGSPMVIVAAGLSR